MAQVRVGKEGIDARSQKIEMWESRIRVWEATKEQTAGMTIMREAAKRAVDSLQKEILSRVKSSSFGSIQDQLDLSKLGGRLDVWESVYYDITDADKKIEDAKFKIATLVDEIKRSQKGELIQSGRA